jgi:prepilin-type N-terminal cleavage/methylation domain-containing protein
VTNDLQPGKLATSPAAAGGFTLVELLVTITIITLLASMVLFGLSGVQQSARERRARAQIQRIHELIAERWQSYETRRVQLDPVRLASLTVIDPATRRGQFDSPAAQRLVGIRELMRLEMPDRVTDVDDDPTDEVVAKTPAVLLELPTLNRAYANVARANIAAGRRWTQTFQSAECLYLILSRIYVDDTNGLEFFMQSEFGDTDGDGMPEILDPWGQPIKFLLSAPGFTSPAVGGFPGGISTIQTADPNVGWDVFDPLRLEDDRPENLDLAAAPNFGFTMFPLIVSAGPDRIYDVRFNLFDADENIVPIHFRETRKTSTVFNPGSPYPWPNDPYAAFADSLSGNQVRMGQLLDPDRRGHLDNIHNHFLEAR